MPKGITMKQIAERLDLSINAVSLALNDKVGVSDETRRLVLKTAEEMGYLDQTDKYRKTFSNTNVCVLINKIYYNTQFYSRVIYGVEKEANANGYNILLQFFDSGISEVPACIQNRKVCGVIVVGLIGEDILKKIYDCRLPIVLADHTSYSLPIDCIVTDNRIGAFESVTNLMRLGYKKIGFFGDFNYSHSNKERFWGYVEAILRIEPDFGRLFPYILKYSVIDNMEPYILSRDINAIADIIKKKKEDLPEVFQCSNDNTAVVLNNALHMLGFKVPEQIAVVGFDDCDIASAVYPPLTTVHVATSRMGIKSMERLIWRINNRKSPADKTVMSVELVIRDSTLSNDPANSTASNI